MNRHELQRNPVLTDFDVKDLNVDPKLPYDDNTYDVRYSACSLAAKVAACKHTHSRFLDFYTISASAGHHERRLGRLPVKTNRDLQRNAQGTSTSELCLPAMSVTASTGCSLSAAAAQDHHCDLATCSLAGVDSIALRIFAGAEAWRHGNHVLQQPLLPNKGDQHLDLNRRPGEFTT